MAVSVKKKKSPKFNGNKSAGNRQKTTASPNSKSSSDKNQKKRQPQRESPFSEEIWGFPIGRELLFLATLGVEILLFVSCFSAPGDALYWLRQIQMGLFGNLAYFVPIVTIIQVTWIFNMGWGFKNEVKIFGEILLLLTLCNLCQLYSSDGFQPSRSILYYFVTGQNGIGGGLLGAVSLKVLYAPLGKAGSTIVAIFFLLVEFVLISEHSVIQTLAKLGELLLIGMKKLWNVLGIFWQKLSGWIHNFVLFLEEVYQENREEIERQRKSRQEEDASEHEEDSGWFRRAKRKWNDWMADDWDDWDEDDSEEDVFERDDSAVEIYPKEDDTDDSEDDWGEFPSKMSQKHAQREVAATGKQTRRAQTGRMARARDASWNRQHAGADSSDSDEEEYRTIERANGTTRTVVRNAIPGEEKPVSVPKKSSASNVVSMRKVPKKKYRLPSVDLLSADKSGKRSPEFQNEVRQTAQTLQRVFDSFGVDVKVTSVSCGPAVTRYELQPAQGVKVSKIVSLADDIKLNLAAEEIRIEAPIPGKAAVGIELPNKEKSIVPLRGLLEDKAFLRHPSKLAFAVGKDLGGQNLVTDIAKMPHLLIAGATGSGKSVCINTLLISILYHAKPDEVRMIMVDPKMVELSVYNGIPHLMLPVVTDPKKASNALGWAVAEMTRRYNAFAQYGVRDIRGYNRKVAAGEIVEKDGAAVKMTQILIVVDELADLMMVAPNDVEDAICRLAQLARAAGIHLVIATQRPSVNVITGIIKANIPSRIAFSVSSGVDSRTILDMNGAEKLLGKGDMLFYPSGYPKPVRVQGAFVTDDEVKRVVDFWTAQTESQETVPEENEQLTLSLEDLEEEKLNVSQRDELFEQAGRTIIEKGRASIGMLQRLFKIGFNRAARIMDQLHEAGVVGEEEGTKTREILMDLSQFEALLEAERKHKRQ